MAADLNEGTRFNGGEMGEIVISPLIFGIVSTFAINFYNVRIQVLCPIISSEY